MLAAADDCLILAWIEPGRPSADAAERLGRQLAATHNAGADSVRRRPATATSAPPRCPTHRHRSWAEFFVERRVLPYLKLARDRATIVDQRRRGDRGRSLRGSPSSPGRRSRRPGSTATCGPATSCGAADGRAWLVDPAAHGGHRETDLAMLALFGRRT